MITYSDDGPDFEPDDPLAVIMRPPSGHLAPPPGRYEEIRRGAARRRFLRTAVVAGATCAAVALLAVPVLRGALQDPVSPTVPLAPPPASSPTAPPTPAESAPVSPRPDARSSTSTPTRPARPTAVTASPSALPSATPTERRSPPPNPRTAAPSTDPTPSSAAR
ncbi:hypothetical protein [Streptomyces sp. NPDC002176]|uniref:hypothetical protein n=1 Tax=Streptomyces sp. NPDC002176 TaxID=3364634 RepID=UPI00384BE2C1